MLRFAEGYATAKEFADRLGVSPNRYGNVEAGASLSIDMAQKIVANVPGCSLDWLYNGVENGLSVSFRKRLRHFPG
jgi:transcriptional regulator with XRE-family HTH domain